MATIEITNIWDVEDALDYVPSYEEEYFLLEVLERFDPHNVNAALREYFRFQARNKLPDFVDADKL